MSAKIFSLEYAESEGDKHFPDQFHAGPITISTMVLPKGSRIDGYIDHVVGTQKDIRFKVFRIDGKVWMSITPMEVASHWVPIRKAKGSVGVGGLGMGYYVLKVMGKKSVKSIDIYEMNPLVVEAFKVLHGHKKGFDKCNFILGDMMDNCMNKTYDFFYNDIYPDLGSEAAIEDSQELLDQNDITDLHYWGMELDIYNSFAERSIAPLFCTDKHILKFFECFFLHNWGYLLEENGVFKELWMFRKGYLE